MRCWRSSEIACPSHRRWIHSETSQLRYMLESHPQVTNVRISFFYFFFIYIYDSVFHTTTIVFEEFHFSTQFSTEGLTDWQSRYVKNIKKKKKCFLSQFLFLYSFRRPTRGSNIGNKVFNSTRNKRLDSLRHGLVNCYFYRERWLLFHRANHQKLAQFIIRIVLVGGRVGVRAATL